MKPTQSTFIQNTKGIFVSPAITLQRLMENKQWIGAFLLICAAVFAISYFTSTATLKQVAEQLPDNQFGAFVQPNTLGRILFSVFHILILFLRLVIGAFFIYLLFGIAGADRVYVHFFSITVNAAIIGTLLPLLLHTVLSFLNFNITNFTNLSIFFPGWNPESLKFLFAAQFDLFYLWFLVIVSLGISRSTRMSRTKAIFTGAVYFLFRATVVVLLTFLALKLRQSIQI